MGFNDEDESQYLENLEIKEEVRPWLAQHLAAPGTVPVWLKSGEKILRNTVNFEIKGWLTFVCSRLDPSTHDHTIPIDRAILVASIMAGFPLNVGNIISRVISTVGQETNTTIPSRTLFPCTLEN